MPILVHSVPMSVKKFTENDLEISKKYVNPDVYPGLYNKDDIPAGLEYVGRQLVDIDDFKIDDAEAFDKNLLVKSRHMTAENAAVQTARVHGRGAEAEKVYYYVRTFGYKLDKIPMSIAVFPDGTKYLINGRTRLEELARHKFTNIIADVYRCTSREGYHEAKQLFNVREDPYSPHTMEDIISTVNYAIKRGWIKRTYDDIQKKIDKVAPGSFFPNEVSKMIHRAMANENISSSVSWTSKQAAKEIAQWGYVDNENNNGIYYFVYSSEAPVKAIPAAAKYLTETLAGKKVKELRVVIHTGTLQGADPELSWKTKIDNFRNEWKSALQAIKDAFFTRESEFLLKIKCFGAIPAVSSLASEYPMDKLVMFHVGKLKNKTFGEIGFDSGIGNALEIAEEI